jgi:pimeloyl-ACP methyl ester carboxylesterase
MTRDAVDRFYRQVGQAPKEQLERFRATHPFKVLAVDDVTWQYISCGQGRQAILLLPGGTGFVEGFFRYILTLEAEYRIVSPTYPPVATMGQLTDGLAAILEAEGIRQANTLGQSLGGMAAQVLVRKYPSQVKSLILSHTTTTSPPVDQAIVLERQKEIETFGRLLPFLPLWLLRSVSRMRLFRHLSGIEAEDKAFWKAYLSEMLAFVSKEYVIASNRCQLDFFQHHAFSRNDLAEWPGKVLILESDTDPHLGPSERAALRTLYPQAQVHTFHSTGHLTLIVNPGGFLSVARSFFERE